MNTLIKHVCVCIILTLFSTELWAHEPLDTIADDVVIAENMDTSDHRNIDAAATHILEGDSVVCDDLESALSLAATFSNVGADASRFSVAFDAFMKEEKCSYVTDVLVSDVPLDLTIESEDVNVYNVRACEDCEPSEMYALDLSTRAFNNIFRCALIDADFRYVSEEFEQYSCWMDASAKAVRNTHGLYCVVDIRNVVFNQVFLERRKA